MFDKMTIHRILSVMLVLFLASCASTRTKPSIYLQSADMTMELHRAALGITDLAISKDGTLLLTSDTGGMGDNQALGSCPWKTNQSPQH
jgi:hypothetical protein